MLVASHCVFKRTLLTRQRRALSRVAPMDGKQSKWALREAALTDLNATVIAVGAETSRP